MLSARLKSSTINRANQVRPLDGALMATSRNVNDGVVWKDHTVVAAPELIREGKRRIAWVRGEGWEVSNQSYSVMLLAITKASYHALLYPRSVVANMSDCLSEDRLFKSGRGCYSR